jgi:LPS export ABC transporter permease LptG
VRILSVYLLREFSASSAAVLAGLLVTWLAGDSLRRLDDFARGGREALRKVMLVAIEILPYAVPIACLAGAVWTLSRAARHRELVAIRSGGIPLQRALAPLLAAAAAIALALGAFVDRVVIPARIALEQQSDAEPGRPRALAGRYWVAHEPWVFSAARYDPPSRTLRDVTMLRLDAGGRVVERVDADEARNVERDVWELRNARARGFGADGGIESERYADLRLELGVRGEQYERAHADPQKLSLHRMARALRRLEAGEAEQAALLGAAFHSRLLEPAAVLILVLFAIPLGVGDSRQGDSLPRALLQSLGFALAFWLCWALALVAAHLPWVPAFAPPWLVVIAALVLGTWRYRRISE